MAWLILLAIAMFIAYKFPKFRIPLVAIGLIIVACIAYGMYEKHEEEELSKSRINANEIELVNLQLKSQNEAGAYILTGRIKNNSKKYTLSELKLKTTMNEIYQGHKNEVIDEETADISCNIPPMQSRYIEENINFAGLHNVKDAHLLRWQYSILEIKGK